MGSLAFHRERGTEGPASEDAESVYCLGNANEAGNVCAQHIVAWRTVFIGGFCAGIVDVAHDRCAAEFGLFASPACALCALLTFAGWGLHILGLASKWDNGGKQKKV